jgi:hypothetical protein
MVVNAWRLEEHIASIFRVEELSNKESRNRRRKLSWFLAWFTLRP